jgi:hypothetical protein
MPQVDSKAAASPEQKPGEIPVDALSRAGLNRARDAEDLAAVGGEIRQNHEEGREGTDASDTEPAEHPSLEPADADRFAMAFRPSWAPLAGASDAKPAQRIGRPPRAEHTPRVVPITQDEPLTVPGLHRKRRAAIWAAASVASFLALTYWGVSSATKTPHPGALRPLSSAPVNPSSHAVRAPEAAAPAGAPDKPAPVTTPDEPTRAATQSTTNVAAGSAELQPSGGPRLEPVAVPAQSENDTPAASEASAAATRAEPAKQTSPTSASPTSASPTSASPTSKNDAPAAVAATTPSHAEPGQAMAVRAAPAERSPQTPAAGTPPPPTAAATAASNKEHEALGAARAEPTPLHSRNPLLSVRAMPDNVRLWLDGQRMANPFGVRLPRGSKHRIEARADGYETSAQTVRIESDAKLTIAVKRTPPARPHAVQAVPSNVRDDRSKPVDKRKRGAGFVAVSPY